MTVRKRVRPVRAWAGDYWLNEARNGVEIRLWTGKMNATDIRVVVREDVRCRHEAAQYEGIGNGKQIFWCQDCGCLKGYGGKWRKPRCV